MAMKKQMKSIAVFCQALLLAFLPAGMAYALVEATGGSATNDIDVGGVPYRVHVFTNTGSADFVVSAGGTVEYLIVGGGGGGGSRSTSAGGGGAGGLVAGIRGEL